MMTCEHFRENMEAFLSGELDQQTAYDVRNHADSCNSCAEIMQSTTKLMDTLKGRSIHPMPAYVESTIRSRIKEEIDKARCSVNPYRRRLWALGGAVALTLVLAGFMLMRQQPVTAAEIVARSEVALASISSYHIKYKSTLIEPGNRKSVAYYESWYKAPDRLKLELTQPGSRMINLVTRQGRWTYVDGSAKAFVTPVSADEQAREASTPIVARSPRDMLKEFGKGYTYTGTETIGRWECDVIEGHFPGNRHVRACIDRRTGILLQHVVSDDEIDSRWEIVTLKVDEAIPDSILELKPPSEVLIVKTVKMSNELLNADLKPFASDGVRGIQEPHAVTWELEQLAKQGEQYNADLARLYEPGYIPDGYKFVAAATYGKRYKMPDGSVRVDFTEGYSAIHIDYINPQTGDTIVITESVKKLKARNSREILLDGFRGHVKTYKQPFAYIELFWSDNNIYFSLSASSITEQEAVKIAKSMHPLGTAAPSLPAREEPAVVTPYNPEGTWKITALVEGVIREKEVERAVQVIRKRLHDLGLRDVKVRSVPVGRIEVTAYTKDPNQLEKKITMPDHMPVKLLVYTREKL